ncbi:hypothetical protein C8R45DRAFT_1070323 [Mycena sanguinolenta]|nr:hypothetical protein C8R45DRAFT_1070323 [Mycena sanguinolenta]
MHNSVKSKSKEGGCSGQRTSDSELVAVKEESKKNGETVIRPSHPLTSDDLDPRHSSRELSKNFLAVMDVLNVVWPYTASVGFDLSIIFDKQSQMDDRRKQPTQACAILKIKMAASIRRGCIDLNCARSQIVRELGREYLFHPEERQVEVVINVYRILEQWVFVAQLRSPATNRNFCERGGTYTEALLVASTCPSSEFGVPQLVQETATTDKRLDEDRPYDIINIKYRGESPRSSVVRPQGRAPDAMAALPQR